MKADKAIHNLRGKFHSSNMIEVTRAVITREEFEALEALVIDVFNSAQEVKDAT